MVYKVSSRTARVVIQRNPVLKNKNKQQKRVVYLAHNSRESRTRSICMVLMRVSRLHISQRAKWYSVRNTVRKDTR